MIKHITQIKYLNLICYIERKVIFLLLIFSLLPYLCLARKINVKIFDDSRISISLPEASTLDLGILMCGNTFISTQYKGRAVVKNDGSVNIGLSLKMNNLTPDFQLVESNPKTNEIRIFGIFHQWDAISPTKDDYQQDDLITTKDKDASTNVFAIPDHPNNKKGYLIEPDQDRSIFFRLDEPKGIRTSSVKLNIGIYITAFMVVEQEEPHHKPEEKIFTPNGDGINDVLVFHGLGDNVNIKILDIRGHAIRMIKNKEEWDGKDEDNKYVPSGAYIYQYTFNNQYFTGIIVVAK